MLKIEITPDDAKQLTAATYNYAQKLDSGLRWIWCWQNGHVMSHNNVQRRQELRKEFFSMARRKQYDNRFKAQVAIEAIKNERTMAQIASDYEVHPNQVRQWKKQMLAESPQLFANGHTQSTSHNDRLIAELYRQIGQLKVELDWLQ